MNAHTVAPQRLAVRPPDAVRDGDDGWFRWLLHTRHGGDAGYAAGLRRMIDDIRDRVLDNAGLAAGQTIAARTIADIGCGDGLAGFGALERQPANFVTFIDSSPQLIAHVRDRAERCGVAANCQFVVAAAETLAPIAAASVDVVLVRAVLAYIDDKSAALRACRRILRPGGRISIVDPIFQDQAFEVAGMASALRGGDRSPAAMFLGFMHRLRSAYVPDSLETIRSNSLTNYNERDLVRLFEHAGFVNIHLRLHVDSVPALAMPWQAFLASSPRAGTPTIDAVLEARFLPDERRAFEAVLRPRVEAGANFERNVNAYVFADAAN